MLLPEEPEVLDSRDLTALNLSQKRAFGALCKTITTKKSLFCWGLETNTWVLGIAGRESKLHVSGSAHGNVQEGAAGQHSHGGEREWEKSC